MNISQLFIESMNEYNDQKTKSPGKDTSVNAVQIIENIMPQYLHAALKSNGKDYLVKGSCGVGRWAEIPWITIMNKQVTTNVSNGYYLTYLLSSNMEDLYLAFMFAVTDNKELDDLIPNAQRIVRSNLKELDKNILFDQIEKLGNSQRAKQYTKATVAYIHYSKFNMPTEDRIWIRDLNNMIQIYETYIKESLEGYEEIRDIELVKRDIPDILTTVSSFIQYKGFFYSENNIKNLYLSLRSKPFVIISGISGTGKTKIVQLFAEAIGATEENGQFKLIPVRPDWSDSSDLLGYRDIKGEFVKGPLTDIVEHALNNPDLPHFVLLDEMNLARVEYYFSDVLSVMESRKKDEEGNFISSPLITFKEDGEEKTFTLPGNLYVIGTVNMDETTHSFSKKVLDRANTIEFNEIDLMNFGAMVEKESVKPIRVANDVLQSTYIHLIDAFSSYEPLIRKVSEKINAINEHLKAIHAQVGYRVRDEISFYLAHNAEAGMLLTENEAMDFCIMQKILPRISGTETVVRSVLENLEEELNEYPKCSAKINEMKKRLDDHGFVSFWTA